MHGDNRTRMVTAARAEESERADAYVRDPLAAILAGRKAMRARKRFFAARPKEAPSDDKQPSSAPEQQQQRQGRPIPRLVFRTLFFDHAIQAAVGLGPAAMFRGLQAAQGGRACAQVSTGPLPEWRMMMMNACVHIMISLI